MLGAIKSLRNSLYNHPVAFVSSVMGIASPVLLFVVYPIRREMGYKPTPDAPKTYPVPKRARVPLTGFDD
ncbi:n19m, NADH-ubiquinone oxidoreductase 9.5 kDa subunit [Polyrhizophydium stewartii]|uniref:N19m, NADH-ubiquinone oxidoreductase 9.5 kDa subunit n=1 Tax=Polyrhizophydium stewartii TaxID=2732419 RepID=A0ABR4N4J9_9FUNG